MHVRRSLSFALTFGLSALPAAAATLTSNTLMNTLTLPVNPAALSTAGPVEVGPPMDSVIFTSTTSASIIDRTGVYGLGANGTWGGGRSFYALNGLNDTMTLTFADPVSGVGAFVNYSPSPLLGDASMSILGVGGAVLETFNLYTDAPISTPGGLDDGAFRGFTRATDEITAIRFTGSYMVADEIVFSRAPVSSVPLPAGLPLLLVGLSALHLSRRVG